MSTPEISFFRNTNFVCSVKKRLYNKRSELKILDSEIFPLCIQICESFLVIQSDLIEKKLTIISTMLKNTFFRQLKHFIKIKKELKRMKIGSICKIWKFKSNKLKI